MIIELWGVRGSLATPTTTEEYRKKLKKVLNRASGMTFKDETSLNDFIEGLPLDVKSNFGGNTTCISVTGSSGKVYVIDCGTGIVNLGNMLMSSDAGKGQAEIDIFLTHTHWDHVQGLPFFKPAYVPGNKLNFYSPYKDLEERFTYQQDFRFFPVKLTDMASIKTFNRLKPGTELELEKGLYLDFYSLKHPGGSFAYRFRQDGKTFIFCTDAEFNGEYVEKIPPKGKEFFQNADLLLIDSQYTLDESFMKLSWGHTSYTMAVNCGISWNIKELVLTHHEPAYNDEKLCENFNAAIKHKSEMDSNMKLTLAIEGEKFVL